LGITLASPPHFWQIDTSMSPKAPTVDEHPLETLGSSGHGLMTLFECLIFVFLSVLSSASFGWRHIDTVFAIWSKYSMEPFQVYSRPGDQGSQFGDEIQRIEDDVSDRRPEVPCPKHSLRSWGKLSL
jgi:hypothetical protein